MFYQAKNIFLTGGTGFMGAATVEKLLRSFPEIGNIYMLVRPKNGITIEERKATYLNNAIFDRLKSEQNIEQFSQKLHWIEGDINMTNLGISEENIGKLQNVINFIIHCAAELSFTLPLQHYVNTNIRGTYDLLNIAKGCTKLNAFVYISTIYCQTRHGETFTTEDVMESKLSPINLMKMSEKMANDDLHQYVKKVDHKWLNYYLLSKNYAENACVEFEDRLPIAIFRPSLIAHSYAEPKPYYIGNSYSFPRILMEAHRGFVLFCHPKSLANVVPVDYTTNAMLAVLKHTSQNPNNKLKVYNYSNNNHPCSCSDAFRYYSNTIPGYEKVLVPLRYKLLAMKDAASGSSEYKMRKKFEQFEEFLKTIKIGLWIKYSYANNNIEKIWHDLTDEEKKLLPFDIGTCDWEKYYSNMVANQYGVDIPQFGDLREFSH